MPFSGHLLRECRVERGVSKELLAVAVGKSCGTITGYEADTIEPPLRVIEALADSLGVELSDLIVEDRVADSRRAQGLDGRVTDEAVLQRVAQLLHGGAA